MAVRNQGPSRVFVFHARETWRHDRPNATGQGDVLAKLTGE
ncbi:hypothetical protein RRSWK_03480 [Rhodopirellula sp. SWK7]|nr:hypothetical protein RRSWK_03480 [Rhodopirellula sp. SWK7]